MIIRKGEPKDMQAVLDLIIELAIFEKEPDAVLVTVDDLIRDGFSEKPLFHCFVAEVENTIIGIALYYYRYSTWKGKTIHDILEMPVSEAATFFQHHRKIHRTLDTLNAVGLGYIRLGQPATTLSGGEAQRVKLAAELAKRSTGHTIYLLDEPTTGLHFEDVRRLLTVLSRLVDKGNTVLVIEHNLDVIKLCDHIIDIGKEGGMKGGKILCIGTPEEISLNKQSYTAGFLKKELNL